MCGIAGALFWSDLPDGRDPRLVVQAMVDAQRHRGPDGAGLVACGGGPEPGAADRPRVVLGHRRLAILDLSDRAAQPMASPRGPVWVTYNGEVYNFRAVRRELEARGRRFASDSDTEVILQGYEEWGGHVVDRLRGMFALAIWDGERRRLFVARDRVGIKPLYLYRHRAGWLFASEVRALLASGLVPRRLDRESLDVYLAYQSVPPPRTLVEGVEMLRPGCARWMGPGAADVEERQYWDWLDTASDEGRDADGATARRRVGELLAESAALHLVSDVPVGIFLSGGIDSGALVALARGAGVTPRTFSIALPGSPHDEAPFARAVAERFGAEHTEIPLSEGDFRDGLPEALACVDHPSGDGLNTFVVARAVRAAGVKAAWSGLGGDEVFGGYPSFARMRRLAACAPAWRHSPPRLRSAAATAVRLLGRESIGASKAAAVIETDATIARALPVLRQVFGAAERRALLGERVPGRDPYVDLLESAVRRHPDTSPATLVSFGEARTYMHDVLLRDTDQMGMAHGLEARVPLLDHPLIEYVMGLPDAVKGPRRTAKALLVESLPGPLPAACVDRPKQGFVLPFDRWMKGELRAFCEAHLEVLERKGVLAPAAAGDLWRAFLAGGRRTSWSRPWTLVALGAWIAQTGVAPA